MVCESCKSRIALVGCGACGGWQCARCLLQFDPLTCVFCSQEWAA